MIQFKNPNSMIANMLALDFIENHYLRRSASLGSLPGRDIWIDDGPVASVNRLTGFRQQPNRMNVP